MPSTTMCCSVCWQAVHPSSGSRRILLPTQSARTGACAQLIPTKKRCSQRKRCRLFLWFETNAEPRAHVQRIHVQRIQHAYKTVHDALLLARQRVRLLLRRNKLRACVGCGRALSSQLRLERADALGCSKLGLLRREQLRVRAPQGLQQSGTVSTAADIYRYNCRQRLMAECGWPQRNECSDARARASCCHA